MSKLIDTAKKKRYLYLLEKLKNNQILSQREIAELSKFEDGDKSKQTVQEARAKDLQNKRQKRFYAQDIGEIPLVANVSRKKRCKKSFRLFCLNYFGEAFYLKWCDDHLNIISKIEHSVIKGGTFAYAMPRGSGKTTLAIAAAIWAILYGHRRYVCLIGSASKQSLNLLQSIQSAFLGNQKLLDDFPEVIYPIRCLDNNAHKQRGQRYNGELTYSIWGTHKIVLPTIPNSTSSGSVITVDSLDSNIRGQIHTTIDGYILRPDFVLIDDPQTDESARSFEQTTQRLKIINGAVLGLSGPGKKIAGLLMITKICDDDLADQLLDRKKAPDWRGIKMKMLYSFPSNMKLWDKYAEIRADCLMQDKDINDATKFYKDNRPAMDNGAIIAWPDRKNIDEISAIQNAMNLFYKDRNSFFSEYQNEPLPDKIKQDRLTVEEVMSKINNRNRGEIPLNCQTLTGFIDVHDKILYWVICAWQSDFTGFIVDYGTFPEQGRLYFTLREASKSLSRLYGGGLGKDAAIAKGIEDLAKQLVGRKYQKINNGGIMQIERLLVDSGYKPELVEIARHKVGQTMMASKGEGIGANKKPMSSWAKKPGERFGNHWLIPNISRSREFQHVKIDTNFWKSFCYSALKTPLGDKGCLSIFGDSPNQHKLIAEHIAASEYWTETTGNGRTLHEWKVLAGSPDNHWFDCVVGNFVAASMCGINVDGGQKVLMDKKPVSFSQMQRMRKNAR